MLQLATLTGRGLALTSSLAVHASVALVLGGLHGLQAAAPERALPAQVDIAVVESAPSEPLVVATSTAPRGRSAGVKHAHTHPYPMPAHHDDHPHDPALVHPALPAHDAAPVFALAVPVAAAAQPFALKMVAGHAASASPASGEAGADVFAEDAVDQPARLSFGPTPLYPRPAAEAAIEADVPMEIVVDARGHVTSARVLSPAGFGLDQAALAGIRVFRFRPATAHGQPCAVRMKWVMQFRLQ